MTLPVITKPALRPIVEHAIAHFSELGHRPYIRVSDRIQAMYNLSDPVLNISAGAIAHFSITDDAMSFYCSLNGKSTFIEVPLMDIFCVYTQDAQGFSMIGVRAVTPWVNVDKEGVEALDAIRDGRGHELVDSPSDEDQEETSEDNNVVAFKPRK